LFGSHVFCDNVLVDSFHHSDKTGVDIINWLVLITDIWFIIGSYSRYFNFSAKLIELYLIRNRSIECSFDPDFGNFKFINGCNMGHDSKLGRSNKDANKLTADIFLISGLFENVLLYIVMWYRLSDPLKIDRIVYLKCIYKYIDIKFRKCATYKIKSL